jgi:DnaJ C terminal domain
LRKQSKPSQEHISPNPAFSFISHSNALRNPASKKRQKGGHGTAQEIPNIYTNDDSNDLDDFVHISVTQGNDPKDPNAAYPIQFTLEELFHGARHRYRLERHFLSGKRKNIVFDVDIPPGCRPGSKVLFHGVGDERADGTLQDVVFVIEEASHERFRRVKDDLIVDVKLQLPGSRRGEVGPRVALEGLNGEMLDFVIDYPTDRTLLNGRVVVPGAGMPVRRKGEIVGRGDLLVRWVLSFVPFMPY